MNIFWPLLGHVRETARQEILGQVNSSPPPPSFHDHLLLLLLLLLSQSKHNLGLEAQSGPGRELEWWFFSLSLPSSVMSAEMFWRTQDELPHLPLLEEDQKLEFPKWVKLTQKSLRRKERNSRLNFSNFDFLLPPPSLFHVKIYRPPVHG